MRTTLTLDPDVASLLEAEVHRRRQPFKRVVNDAIRQALSPRASRKSKPFRIAVHKARLLAGIDPARLNQLADELEDEASLRKLRRLEK
ncbi:MAG: antitoxin [Myxococcales bacterium]|nr:antitoxin [Myxococcales bacterium]